MKTVKFKAKLIITVTKSLCVALGVIAILSAAMIAGSVSRPFAVFFNENILLFAGIFAAIFILVFFVFFGLFLRGDISRIDDIRKALITMSESNYDISLKCTAKDEIALVSESVNTLAASLARAEENKTALENRKKELIADISHDLRTPLTSILGYLDLIGKKKYSSEEELGSYAQVAHSKCCEMKLLIDDLFEYSKLDNDDVSLDIQRLNINEFLSQVLVSFIPEFMKTSISYKFSHPEEINYVDIDPVYYRRVFENILQNSISYGKSGSLLEIIVSRKDGFIKVLIINDKADMPPDACERIFERNYRGESKSGSSGLGLAIVKQIVDMHGDEITAYILGDRLIFEVCLLPE